MISIFWNSINLPLLPEICISKEALWLLVNQAARYSQPSSLTYLFPCPHLTSSQDLPTTAAGLKQVRKK